MFSSSGCSYVGLGWFGSVLFRVVRAEGCLSRVFGWSIFEYRELFLVARRRDEEGGTEKGFLLRFLRTVGGFWD